MNPLNSQNHRPLGRREFMKMAAALPLALAAGGARAARSGEGLTRPLAAAGADWVLPPGVEAVWDMALAQRAATPTRERRCINGLWRWQPAGAGADPVPEAGWGYFKVPGCWPGISDYMQKDCQTLFVHPDWKDIRPREVTAAWYQREVEIPKEWAGRRIALAAEYVNSLAEVFIDGKPAGKITFPAGELDLTEACKPGGRYLLTLRVQAMPLKAVLQSYIDTANARNVQGTVERRGLCGDVWLVSTPAGPRLGEVKIDTSVRKGEIALSAALEGLAAGKQYRLHALIREIASKGNQQPVPRIVTDFQSEAFDADDLKNGRFSFAHPWKPEKLWDIHAPENYYLELALHGADGERFDELVPIKFGFREFWIDGRDFYLNGTRIFLSAVPIDNAQVSAHASSYLAAFETMARLKSFGINFVYTHNYGCQPGDHLAFTEILRAADEIGMLVALSQPHFSHYDWKAPDADAKNGYARHAEFYVGVARNHPSVVMYSMNHNSCGYSGDMDPDIIDGVHDRREKNQQGNVERALRAEAIVKALDPARIVYHHAGGNIGAMHTINFYPNFVPIQEMSDWFGHWAKEGVKPLFTCEYGAPFTWDWAMYRGWYKDQREFGSAKVPWEFCLAEWQAQFLGDAGFKISEQEKTNLRWESKQFEAGRTWCRWDYRHQLGSSDFIERDTVFAMYFKDNWRAFRTLGVSANSPWEYSILWRLRPGVDKGRRELPVEWARLQQAGFSADYLADRYEKIDQAFESKDWIPGAGAQALMDNNRDVLAYIGSKAGAVTGKEHNYAPGETVEKQIVLINNSRRTLTCEYEWYAGSIMPGRKNVELQTGEIKFIPIRIELKEGSLDFEIHLNAWFGNNDLQQDTFNIHVVKPPPPAIKTRNPVPDEPVALYDPRGETGTLLEELGIKCRMIKEDADLGGEKLLVIGKGALSAAGAGPNLARVREGLKAVVFEQTTEALERRLGFRVTEYGLRQAFPRARGHRAQGGLQPETLRDWRGEATLTPPQLKYESRPRYGPTVQWCGIPVTRLWRCGNRGNVASVLIEKPACGDFLPIIDGGFSLQYGTLMEYREGAGVVFFCQMDVTGRTESDPAARRLALNLMNHAAAWRRTLGDPFMRGASNPAAPEAPRRKVIYTGDPAGKAHLERAGFAPRDLERELAADAVLVVAPGGAKALAGKKAELAGWLNAGGRLLALGLDAAEANAFLPTAIRTERREHISGYYEHPTKPDSILRGVLRGIGPADLHNRMPREMPLVTSGAEPVGDGVLAVGEKGNIVFCQMAPWQFDAKRQSEKRTFRRTSFLLARLLGNLGGAASTPLLERFAQPAAAADRRWLEGLYLDEPEEWDDPYRAFRW